MVNAIKMQKSAHQGGVIGDYRGVFLIPVASLIFEKLLKTELLLTLRKT